MHYRIRHTTRYQYPDPVSHCYNEARMSPFSDQLSYPASAQGADRDGV